MGVANGEKESVIPRPSGTAGNTWSIQVEMGLQGKDKKYDMYKAIQVSKGIKVDKNVGLLTPFIVQRPRLGSQCTTQLGGLMARNTCS